MIGLDFLKKVAVLNGLDDDQLDKILKGCREKEYKKGDLLFKEGEEARHIWMVTEGQVDIRFDLPGRDSSEVSTVYSERAADTFGWSCLVPPYKYLLSAYCESDICRVARLDKEYMNDLFESDSRMGQIFMSNLAGIMSTRFHDMQKSSTVPPYSMVKIIVHMATCGIAAGAREVMTALQDELIKTDRHDIRVESSGCIGKCATEPNVTVEIEGEDPVIYQKMNPDKIRRVFKEHVLGGSIQTDLALVA